MAMGYFQCLPFSWTALRGKHCQHPIAVMGVVDTLRHGYPFLPLTRDSNVNLATKKISKTSELATPFTILVEE